MRDADTTCRDNQCSACGAGTYLTGCNTSSGQMGTCEPCTSCGADQYVAGCGTDSVGTCQNCPANMESPVGSRSLAACRCVPGYDAVSGADCKMCTPGKYKDSASSACTPCEAGKFAAISGAHTCTPCTEECETGQVQMSPVRAARTACAKGAASARQEVCL